MWELRGVGSLDLGGSFSTRPLHGAFCSQGTETESHGPSSEGSGFPKHRMELQALCPPRVPSLRSFQTPSLRALGVQPPPSRCPSLHLCRRCRFSPLAPPAQAGGCGAREGSYPESRVRCRQRRLRGPRADLGRPPAPFPAASRRRGRAGPGPSGTGSAPPSSSATPGRARRSPRPWARRSRARRGPRCVVRGGSLCARRCPRC